MSIPVLKLFIFYFLSCIFSYLYSLKAELRVKTKNAADCKKHNLRRSFLSKSFFVYEADKTFGVAFDGSKIVFFHAFKERRGHGESERAGFEPFF